MSQSPTPPMRLGAYELGECLGRGAVGAVYRGRHRGTGQLAAVKQLHTLSGRARATFAVEVQASARLRHPSIVEIVDCGGLAADSDTPPWLAMELLENGALDDAQLTDWRDVTSVLESLLDGLAYAHSRGVLHRDIKPGNLMMAGGDGALQVKIADFGIARTRRDSAAPAPLGSGGIEVSEVGSSAGTPGFMAPEQMQGLTHRFGPATDLYAVGCIAWWLVTGCDVFEANSPLSLLRAHMVDPVPPLTPRIAVPAGLDAWLRWLLAKEPEDRFRRAADAVWALRRLGPANVDPDLAVTSPAVGAGHAVPTPRPSRARDATVTDLTTLDIHTDARITTGDGDDVAAALSGEVRSASVVDGAPVDVPHAPPPEPAAWVAFDDASRRPTGLGLLPVRPPPFVGRDDELAALTECFLDAVASGSPRLAWVTGAAGVGKSALVRTFVERAHELGAARVMRAGFSACLGPVDGLGPMIADELGVAGLEGDPLRDRLAEALELAGVHPDLQRLEANGLATVIDPRDLLGDDIEHPLHEQLSSVCRHVARRARDRPLIVWLDDIQWGYQAAMLLQAATRWFEGREHAPVLWIATERADFDATSYSWLDESRALADVHIELSPVATASIAEMLDGMVELSPEDTAWVAATTAGSPMFAVQLLSLLALGGDLVDRGDGVRLATEARGHRTLDQMWRQRVASLGLDASGERALELAACMGRVIELREWTEACAVAGLPDDAWQRACDALVARGLAATPEPRHAEFVHDAVRATLEARAREAGRWASANAICARWLWTHGRRSVRSAGRLHRFLVEAGDLERAARQLHGYARRALASGDSRRTIENLDELERLRASVEIDDADLHYMRVVARADMLAQSGEPGAAHALVSDLDPTPELDARNLCARAFPLAWTQMLLGDVEGSRQTTETALARLPAEATALVAQIRLESLLGDLAGVRGDLDEMRARLERADALAEHSELPRMQSNTSRKLGMAALRRGDLDAAEAYFSAATDGFERLGHLGPWIAARTGLGEVERFLGNYASARNTYALLERQADGDSPLWVQTQFNLALCDLGLGAVSDAHDRLHQLASRLESRGEQLVAPLARFMALASAPTPLGPGWANTLDGPLSTLRARGGDKDCAWVAHQMHPRMSAAGEHAAAATLARAANALEQRVEPPTVVSDAIDIGD